MLTPKWSVGDDVWVSWHASHRMFGSKSVFVVCDSLCEGKWSTSGVNRPGGTINNLYYYCPIVLHVGLNLTCERLYLPLLANLVTIANMPNIAHRAQVAVPPILVVNSTKVKPALGKWS